MYKKKIFYFLTIIGSMAVSSLSAQDETASDYPYREMPQIFPGTKQLTWEGDLSEKMLDGAHRFVEAKIAEASSTKKKYWKYDLSGPDNYDRSISGNRVRLKTILGIEDSTTSVRSPGEVVSINKVATEMNTISAVGDSDVVAETSRYKIYEVRWPALPGVNGEGILIQPKTASKGFIVVIPDADQSPEQLAGLRPGIEKASQFARHFAENDYEVLIPIIVGRKKVFEEEERQQTRREWLYRQAYQMGRHIIGYEVQKVMAAIDWAKQKDRDKKIGVAGYGEGGLLAFYAAAVDTRIDAALVSGYFTNREKVWDEPIYRNVWKHLNEFGDAEVASLVAPRGLVIEFSNAPILVDQIDDHKERKLQMEGLPYTGYKGKLVQPSLREVKNEFDRIDNLIGKSMQKRMLVAGTGDNPVKFGSAGALTALSQMLGQGAIVNNSWESTKVLRKPSSDSIREVRQVKEIEDHVQQLVHDGDKQRNKFFLHKVMPEFGVRRWSTKPYHHFYDPQRFTKKSIEYRKYFSEEVIGKFTDSLLPYNARTRRIIDAQRYTAYEVVLDVFSEVFATGILLVPKDIKKNERRPVVVCQHGRNDVPLKLVHGNFTIYNDAASKLADQGFVVYVPQNPYRGEDRYRWLSRKANTIGKTLFSFIVAQHDQATRWLGTLPFVDKSRIAFYGLSYGGQTAMRVPAILDAYCLSICSGDFGDGARKVADTHYEGAFVNTIEWEMSYFNMGSTFSYAEMSYLIFPRPFMVERGHHDLVQPPEWVNYEYGKVRYFYDQFGLGDKTEMEQFNGGHTMRGEGTFRFLHKHLNWP